MPAYLDRSYYCHYCNISYNTNGDHICEYICKTCQKPECDDIEMLKCPYCKVIAKNHHCLQRQLDFFCSKRVNCITCNCLQLKPIDFH